MSKSPEQLIIDHETARALVRDLEKERFRLIGECENTVTRPVPESFLSLPNEVSVKFGNCLSVAYEYMLELNEENGGRHDYFECLKGLEGDGVCKKCIESYSIKIGPLAKAKSELGKARRAISAAGKRLIKPVANSE